MDASRFIPFLAAALVIFFAFRLHWVLGLLALAALIGYAAWSGRASMLAAKAQQAAARGDLKTAIRLLAEAVRLNRKQPGIMASYAYLLLKDGQTDKAEEALNAARGMKDADKLELNLRITEALIRWKREKPDEAIALLEDLHGRMQNTMLYGCLGYLYLEKGDLDKALAYNLEAYEYNDSDGVILDNLLTTYILREEWEKARETAEKLMNLNPSFPEAFYHAALVKEHFGYLESAMEHCEWALERPFTALSTESRETIAAKRDELAARLARKAPGPDAANAAAPAGATKPDGTADADREAGRHDAAGG